MKIVVSDTSPLRALHHLQLLNLLDDLYRAVFVPPAVARELEHPPGSSSPIFVADFPFLQLRTPLSHPEHQHLFQELDRGEIEALSLAIDLHADVVLMDELDGRAAATQLGICPTGVLGILIQAKRQHRIARVDILLERLEIETRFFIRKSLREEVL